MSDSKNTDVHKLPRLNGSVPTDEQTDALADAMWQLLDDMGMEGQCVCLLAKAKARVAFDPFAWDEGAIESLMPLADAERIIRECENAERSPNHGALAMPVLRR
jgi:hypothetical protein